MFVSDLHQLFVSKHSVISFINVNSALLVFNWIPLYHLDFSVPIEME